MGSKVGRVGFGLCSLNYRKLHNASTVGLLKGAFKTGSYEKTYENEERRPKT